MNDYDTPEIRCSLRNLSRVTECIEQWGFLSVPHLLWNGASVYKGHLGGPVTLAPIAERLAVDL